MHGVAHLVGGDEDVAAELGFQLAERFEIGDDEAEAIAMHAEAPGNQVFVRGGLRELVAVGVDRDELAALNQLVKMFVQLPSFFPVKAEFADELLISRLALPLPGDVGQDGGVGEHREQLAMSYEL